MQPVFAQTLPDINDLAFIKDMIRGKTYACDMIWKVDPFPHSVKKRHQSTYKTTYSNKTYTALQYNKDVMARTFNMRKTPLSEYVNALHNNKVFTNTQFTSC